MRTTVTLDPDVEQLIREAMQSEQQSFKEVLNEAVRRGFRGSESADREPFSVAARPMRMRAGLDPARLHEIDGDLEVEAFLRTSHALGDASG
jgi:hypothetical protein